MKRVKSIPVVMLMAFIGLTIMSCNENKKEGEQHAPPEMHSNEMNASHSMMDSNSQKSRSKQILADYMTLKDALVATDEASSAKAGKQLKKTLGSFSLNSYSSEEQEQLQDIIEVATEHAEHIGKGDIVHQREHFEMLTKDITDMIEIIGTDTTLYQQYCPMYADDTGGALLSMEKEIRNPYFGDLMMNCGFVQKEIN